MVPKSCSWYSPPSGLSNWVCRFGGIFPRLWYIGILCYFLAFIPRGVGPRYSMQGPPEFLFPFYGLEQGLKVTLSKGLCPLSLDDLKEDRGPGLHRFGEDLQQVALVVPVHQDAELLERGNVLIDLSHPVPHGLVIGGGDLEELHPTGLEVAYGPNDVIGGHGYMLHPLPFIEIEVFLHLGFFLALGGFIDGEFDPAVAIAHDLAHQGGVFGGNVVVVKGEDVLEAHHPF